MSNTYPTHLVQPSADAVATAYAIAWQVVVKTRWSQLDNMDPEQTGALVGKIAYGVMGGSVKTQPNKTPQLVQ